MNHTMPTWKTVFAGLAALGALSMAAPPGQAQNKNQRPPLPEFATGPELYPRDRGANALSPELASLYSMYALTPKVVSGKAWMSLKDLQKRYGLRPGDKNPPIAVTIRVADGANRALLTNAGAAVRFESGDQIFASVPVLRLQQVGNLPFVLSVEVEQRPRIPLPKAQKATRPRGQAVRGPEKLLNAFDAQGLTGKGVIVGVIDTGIDWKHADFIAPDGTSRILFLWDQFDDSFEKSGGKIGSKPPADDPDTHKPMGTVYTRQQINDALQGKGQVNSQDRFGHGTACAGTAAGNGRATANGVPAGTYTGVAPGADLIVVKAASPEVEMDGGLAAFTQEGVRWALDEAQKLKRPVVLNMSYGHHNSAHDGTSPSELDLDSFLGAGKAGRVACVAAGNEGRDNFHASGVFGAKKAGQADFMSQPVDLFISQPTSLIVYFSHKDDWALALHRNDKTWAADGHEVLLEFFKKDDRLANRLSRPVKDVKAFQDAVPGFALNKPQPNPDTDRVEVLLEPGAYQIYGEGNSAQVPVGRFDLYLPEADRAHFGSGIVTQTMISSPGNATNAITVGSFDFQNTWISVDNRPTLYNLQVGELSSFSNPGYRRDRLVKPDICAPARFTISAMAKDSVMAKHPGAIHVTADGFHVAWEGTSAATPFVAGVIALMLEKNPTLDSAQIQQILHDTATHDAFTGGVPNPQWGYGKINPAAAIKAVPAIR